MNVEQLLIRSKEVYDNGGKKEDIYDLLLDSSDDIFELKKWKSYRKSGFEWNNEKVAEFAEENNMTCNEAEQYIFKKLDKKNKFAKNIQMLVWRELKKIRRKTIDWFDFKVDFSEYFLTTKVEPDDGLRHFYSEIKLYFCIPFDKIEEFFKEFAVFAVSNKVDVYFKTRFEKSTDMVTLRFKNLDKFDEIIEFVNKYKEPNKSNPLIDTYDGIGYTLDNGESYNAYLRDMIYAYVSSASNISVDGFRDFIKSSMQSLELPNFEYNTLKSDAPYIFFKNLDNFINKKEFNVDDFKKKYQDLLSLEEFISYENKKKACYRRNLKPYVDDFICSVVEMGYEDEDKVYGIIDKVMNDTTKKCNIDGKEMLFVDVIKDYFDSKDARSELIKSCNRKITVKKQDLMKSLENKSESFIKYLLIELAKLGINNESDVEKGIDSILANKKTIYIMGDKDIDINDILKYYVYKNFDYKDVREFLYDKTFDLLEAFNLFDEIIGSKSKRNIKKNLLDLERFCDDDHFYCPISYEPDLIFNSKIAAQTHSMLTELMVYKYNFEIDESFNYHAIKCSDDFMYCLLYLLDYKKSKKNVKK